MITAKRQFLQDLQKDKDYIEHRKNSTWKEIADSIYNPKGYYTVNSGSYHAVNAVEHDVNCNLFIHLNFFDYGMD